MPLNQEIPIVIGLWGIAFFTWAKAIEAILELLRRFSGNDEKS